MYGSAGAVFSVVSYAIILAANVSASSATQNCSCGYYDATTKILWTEAIIVYFNETTATPIPSFTTESYSHSFEKGWNTQFRNGADLSNVEISNSTSALNSSGSLELRVSPYRSDHLVEGSSVRTSRRDIHYGSFSSLLRSPGKLAGGGGSVLSFAVEYNSTQSISTNLQNKDLPSTASISTLVNDESLDTSMVKYSNMTDGRFENGTLSPWDFTEHRLEWTKDGAKFFIGDSLARSVSRRKKESLLSVPSALYLRHWSNGLATGSQGPPSQATVANVGWVRFFFNSSLTTDSDHASFDSRCQKTIACAANDMTLRGASVFSENSTKKRKQAPQDQPKRQAAIWLAVASISLTAFVLLNPIWKRVRERFGSAREGEKTPQAQEDTTTGSSSRTASPSALAPKLGPYTQGGESSPDAITLIGSRRSSKSTTTTNPSRSSLASPRSESSSIFRRTSEFLVDQPPNKGSSQDEGQNAVEQKLVGERMSPEAALPASALNGRTPLVNPVPTDSKTENPEEEKEKVSPTKERSKKSGSQGSWNMIEWGQTANSARPEVLAGSEKAAEMAASQLPGRKPNADTNHTGTLSPDLPHDRERIDHLAGLVVLACLIVTAISFNLTFVYGDIKPDTFTHYRSEAVARKTISSFFLNPIWIGPFLLTSARFLVAGYLRTGDLLAVAEKAAKQPFRLMLPVTAMVMLEYFFVDCDATKWLEYLPSVTWSTWPFIKGYSNFGSFVSEILELIYLIPNAAPVITVNYCTNVLWTIPVQLQGSWTTLLAVIVIQEIKTPWKRFGFYAFCLVNHWYALSWGCYFYMGIMLADLDITYKWRPYLHARPRIYYPLLLLCVCLAVAGPTMDLLTQRTGIDYAAYEYGIHPNSSSGLAIAEAGRAAATPQYFIPRLNGLVFAAGLQAAVDMSPLIQEFLSLKPFMLIFPHIFTIYLLHGFIFWTLGSWLCVTLATHGLPYWSNVLIVALACYTVLALSAPLVTPVLDALGKCFTMDLWRQARDEPAPRRPSLYPFPPDLFFRYEISYERRPSEFVSMDPKNQRAASRDARSIPRERHPSKDLRTSWYGRESSTTQEHRPSRDVRMIPRQRKSSKDMDTSGLDRRSGADLRVSWHERNQFSTDSRASGPPPSMDPRISWHERNNPSTDNRASGPPSTDPRISWHERNNNPLTDSPRTSETPPSAPPPTASRTERKRPPAEIVLPGPRNGPSTSSPRISWHDGQPLSAGVGSPSSSSSSSGQQRRSPTDPRVSWHERKTSRVARLERVVDDEAGEGGG